MPRSAGILLYRHRMDGQVQLLIVHPGGPFFANKDEGAWTIPKGLVEAEESPEAAARREFVEETGFACPERLVGLGSVRLKSGKEVVAFAAEGDADVQSLRSNTFEMEWPRRSGRTLRFPEVDAAVFASPEEARRRLNPAQAELVDRLLEYLGSPN